MTVGKRQVLLAGPILPHIDGEQIATRRLSHTEPLAQPRHLAQGFVGAQGWVSIAPAPVCGVLAVLRSDAR